MSKLLGAGRDEFIKINIILSPSNLAVRLQYVNQKGFLMCHRVLHIFCAFSACVRTKQAPIKRGMELKQFEI